MTKKVLVTGATGFIGSHLVNALCNKGYIVTGIDKRLNNFNQQYKNYELIIGDIRKLAFHKDYDTVYHLAALISVPESFEFPEEYVSTNIWGTLNIIKSFPKSRIVYSSTSAAAENKSVYGITKRSAEHFMNLHNNSISIRFMNVFGEYQIADKMAFPSFCYALKYNKKAVINGDGSITRDFVYVQDLVDEMIRLGESRIKGQTEVGYGQPVKIIDLYNILARTAKKKPNFKIGPPRKGDMKHTCSKFKIKEPKYGFTEGLRRTVRWYLEEETF